MLETIERMGEVITVPLAAQPNAGKPRDIEGRNLYLCSPDYMASYARRFVSLGVRLVGGCCGTTPDHIRQIQLAVKAMAPGRGAARCAVGRRQDAARKPAACAGPGAAGTRSPAWLTSSRPVSSSPSSRCRRHADTMRPKPSRRPVRCAITSVDVVAVPDGPRSGARLSALSLAVLMSQQHGIETLLQYSCRDRNLLGIQSDLLGAHALGLRNILGITGDARSLGDIPDATAVFDVDSIGLTNVVNRLNHGLDIGGQSIGAPTRFHTGVMANPSRDLDQELKRLEYKVEAGAEFVITRPIFDAQAFERFLQRVEAFRIPIIVGLWPFDSALNAEFMANEVPGVTVPEALVERMRRAASAEAAEAEGVSIARELLRNLRAMAQGVHIFTQSGKIDRAFDVLA